jgi:uncharacterized protein YbaA (DUF1428 family)
MKQQYKGPYTFDVANRTITLQGIEIIPERVLLVVNATIGFVYHNFAIEPNGDVTVVDGNTVIVFPPYKDCDLHRDSDALAIFYDDGVDLGVLLQEEFDETRDLVQTEFDETQTALADFRAEVKAESDETQTLLQTEFDETQTALADFRAEVKAESDETQTLLQTEFDETQTALADFRAEVKAESDETQLVLQAEFYETRGFLVDFISEVKAESDETQTLLQAEFDETQTALTDFRAEVKAESDETQDLIDAKIPDSVDGRIPVETLGKYDPVNNVTVNLVYGAGSTRITWSRDGVVLKTVDFNYDTQGKLTSVAPVP